MQEEERREKSSSPLGRHPRPTRPPRNRKRKKRQPMIPPGNRRPP